MLNAIEKDSRIVLLNGKLKLLDKPVTIDSNIIGYSLVLTNENGKVIASTIDVNFPKPPDSWIEFIINVYEKSGSIPDHLEVKEVSGHLNVYKDVIRPEVLLTLFNELGQYQGFILVKNYSLEEVKDLCLGAFLAGTTSEKYNITFEDWYKSNL